MSVVKRARGKLRQAGYGVRCELLTRMATENPAVALALLPKTDYELKRAIFVRQRQAFAELAEAHSMSLEVYGHAVTEWLRPRVAASEVRVRMRPVPFARFLETGRYLNQFESAASGGAHHHTLRMMIENALLGVPLNARPGDRPAYGYLSCSDEAGIVQGYGEIVLRLRRSVRARSTFMLGDSLDYALSQFSEPLFVPQPVLRPNVLAVVPFAPPPFGQPPAPPGRAPLRDVLALPSLADASAPHRYAEAQIFGGIRPEDLKEVVFTLGAQPSSETSALLGRRQVQWTATEELAP